VATRPFSFDDSDLGLVFAGLSGNIQVGGANNYTTGSAGFTSTRHAWVIRFAGGGAANTDRLRLWKDGVEYTAGTYTGTIPATIPTLSAGRIGARSDGAAAAAHQHYLFGIYPSDALDPAVIATGGALDNHIKTLLAFY
jgi:hypothetical protein